MRLIEKIWIEAHKILNLNWKEVPGKESNPLIKQVFSEVILNDGDASDYDDSAIAWCSIGMNWLVQKCGGKGTRSMGARSWCAWGKKSTGIPGDLVVLRRGTSSWQGHIAILKSKGTLYVETLGFNQDNDFCVRKYLRAQVLDYRTSKD